MFFGNCGRNRLWLAPVLAVSITLAAGAAPPRPIADDFNAAVERVRPFVPNPMGNGHPAARFGLDGYRTEAAALAEAHGPSVTNFLGSKLAGGDLVAYRLAQATLACLAGDPEASAVLTGPLRKSGFREPGVLMALTYAPAPTALALADEAFALRDTEPGALFVASTLYRFFGDDRRASDLEKAIPKTPLSNPQVRPETANLVALRQRLARPPAEQAAWISQDWLIWKACRFNTNSQSLNYDLQLRLNGVCALIRFNPSYLKDRLGASDIEGEELRMILLVAGRRPDPTLIPELADLVATQPTHWRRAVDLLLAIGTRDALAPVERLITPPPTQNGPLQDPALDLKSSDNQRGRISWLCPELARHGDRATLELMETLSADPAYPAEERATFAQVRNTLQRRLGSERP